MTVCSTCSKKLTGSQLSLPHGINKKIKCETKNKLMNVIGPVQSHYLERSPLGKRSLRWEGFEPVVKEWRSDGWWERGWWERWVDMWMRRWIETRLVRLTEWIWKLIPKTRWCWCISKWAICDFQGDGWWARRAGTARRLKSDKVVKIVRLSGCKNFVGEREKFI